MDNTTNCSQNTDSLKLVREGTSQEQRFSPALDPVYAPVDERTIAHRMVFAQAYATKLKYFNSNNAWEGDWQAFFNNDVSALLAVAAVQDVDDYRANVYEYLKFLKDHNNQSKEQDLKNNLGYLFSCAGTLAKQLDVLKEGLPVEIPLKVALQNMIQSQLAGEFKRLIACYKADLLASERVVADIQPGISILGKITEKFVNLYQDGLSKDWTDNAARWADYTSSIQEKSSVYGSGTVFERVNHIATHNLFTSILDQFLKAYARTVKEAEIALEKSFGVSDFSKEEFTNSRPIAKLCDALRKDGFILQNDTIGELNNILKDPGLYGKTKQNKIQVSSEILDALEKSYNYSKSENSLKKLNRMALEEFYPRETPKSATFDLHEPHYALFLTFLRLFEFARTEVNTLTGRHLDFYYREILWLKEKAPEPVHAHLLVELAKQVNNHEFKKGVLFKAGKDDFGKDAFFANDYDFVANQAKVAARKTVYCYSDQDLEPEAPTYPDRERLFASTVANSDDGMGAELTSLDKSWHPFHNKMYQDGELSEIKMPKAEVGFAIASHYLLMVGGKRIVTVTFKATSGVTEIDHKDDIVCLFTAEKGWFKKEAPASKAENEAFLFKADKTDHLTLKITLDGADPAVVPYTAKTHGYNFATNLPVLLVKLKHRDAFEYIYSKLQDIVVEKIDLTVEVEGLKNLAVSNDIGPVDISKPFQPFGASPVANSALVIGSKEVFQKMLSSANVIVEWQSSPAPYPNNITINVITEYLQNGGWQQTGIANKDIKNQEFLIFNENDESYVDAPDLSELEHYNTSSRHGFVRLKLDADFGQNKYQQDLLQHLLRDKDTKNPPVGPTMSELRVDYSALQPINLNSTDADDFNKRNARFFHLAPFGHAEQHPFLNSAKKVFLLPQFGFQRDGAANKSEAEFYIGLTDLKPLQNLALLFQVADGTADPLSNKPDPHIHWSYLLGNEWIPFDKNEVDDKTRGLLNSGIITFAIPRDVSDTNTLLPAGMHWIRAAVASGSEAICRLRRVAAQALKATFTDKGNDQTFPAKVLESGTISKLDQPDVAVKKITQPFATFGGRGREEPKSFYTRVSERLRHKDRGIALWDYERLILEAFPQIYKAKCLNHMEYEPDKYRELAPGHVTVVTIPNQQFHKLRDPFRPYTSLGLLGEIDAFLSKRLSCFVKLHVRNPEFEEIQVKCNVRLKAGLDETFYENKLQEAITRFLSPWAFPGGGSPSFGGKFYKSVLINFVEDLPYVDYVTDFQLLHTFDAKPGPVDKNEIEGSKAISILVSARKHDIEPINPDVAETPGEKCPCEAK
ncbi:MAG: baseplate J/gp47 family protein [Candidatus Scalindua sp.]|nr:baseplate J/gp47 family protein [Candidatus Scalindua sp.]